MVRSVVLATATLLVLTAAFTVFLQGVRVILTADVVSWDVLTTHLTWIGAGLALTTAPILLWMLPRFPDRLIARQLLFLHAFFGAQAYALLLFALTGIYRIFQVKREAERYRDPDPDADVNDLHPDMSAWRARLRIGVFGFLFLWLLAYVAGTIRYYVVYWA